MGCGAFKFVRLIVCCVICMLDCWLGWVCGRRIFPVAGIRLIGFVSVKGCCCTCLWFLLWVACCCVFVVEGLRLFGFLCLFVD